MTTRRTHLTRLGLATAAGLAAAAAAPAPAGAQPRLQEQITLTARRKQITLPAVPSLGIPYIATFDLTDSNGAPAGTAFAGAIVVDLSLQGPVVQAIVVLRLSNGEIHYQRVMDRFGAYPRRAVGAIVGGTGSYASISGEVHISWPDAERIDIVIQPAATSGS